MCKMNVEEGKTNGLFHCGYSFLRSEMHTVRQPSLCRGGGYERGSDPELERGGTIRGYGLHCGRFFLRRGGGHCVHGSTVKGA